MDEECDDEDFKNEMKGTRSKLDKKTGEGKETDATERAENKKEVYIYTQYNFILFIDIRVYICMYIYRMICSK